jgi:SAM-dependent methyltransferase
VARTTRNASFDDSYRGTPPWDIGRPQSEIVIIEEGGKVRGRVLDVGCGTGENALYLASRGYQVVGVDFSPRAIEKARRKAADRDLEVEFRVHDALSLETLDGTFDTVVDSGLFHTLSDEERVRFVSGLGKVLRPGGHYHMLSFSDREPGGWGPRRVTAGDIEEAFRDGWRVEGISDACFESNILDRCVMAWLATLVRE